MLCRVAAIGLLMLICGCDRANPVPLSATSLPSSAPLAPTETPIDPYSGIPARVATTPFPLSNMPAEPEANFAFSLGYGACGISRVVNTFTNTVTQIEFDGTQTTIALALEPAELAQIYSRMRAISLLSYPRFYTSNLPDTIVRLSTAPHPIYELRVRNGAIEQELRFDDAVQRPITTEMENLRGLIDLIVDIAETKPALATLAPPNEVCA